jgi:hypothetical protein
MPGTTSTYGFPYLEPADPPDIAGATEDLAEAVEGVLVAGVPMAATALLSSQFTLGSTIADLPGCTITRTTPRSNAVALVTWMADCQLFTAGSTSLMAVVNLMVDGVDLASPQAVWGPGNMAVQANTRGTVAGSATVALASAGSHTFKLRGAAASATGQIRLNSPWTSLSVLILP